MKFENVLRTLERDRYKDYKVEKLEYCGNFAGARHTAYIRLKKGEKEEEIYIKVANKGIDLRELGYNIIYLNFIVGEFDSSALRTISRKKKFENHIHNIKSFERTKTF